MNAANSLLDSGGRFLAYLAGRLQRADEGEREF